MKLKRYQTVLIISAVALLSGFSSSILINSPPSELSLISPLPGARVSAKYGVMVDPVTGSEIFHGGIDLVPQGSKSVVAAASGIVELVTTEYELGEQYGTVIILRHNEVLRSFYAHLESTEVIPGQEIRQGGTIGTVGKTGRNNNVHLHFEVWKQDDPTKYFLMNDLNPQN